MASAKIAHAHRVCKQCGSRFPKAQNGRPRITCSPECHRLFYDRETWRRCSVDGCDNPTRARDSLKCTRCYTVERKRSVGICTVAGCQEPATRSSRTICEKHYYRVRRNGSTDLAPVVESLRSNGYVMVKAPGHSLAGKNGWAFEHRVVAFRKYGEGPHDCHWCGISLQWSEIVVDHINEVKTDNRPDNLVVACTPCNRARGSMISFIRRMQGHRIPELIATFSHMRCTEPKSPS